MAKYILKNGVLYHHGIKGQKWGERNYQNDMEDQKSYMKKEKMSTNK